MSLGEGSGSVKLSPSFQFALPALCLCLKMGALSWRLLPPRLLLAAMLLRHDGFSEP